MKIWFISDTHNQHMQLKIPEADYVIHCGDESTHGNPWMNEPECRRFFEWFEVLPMEKIFVPGNHSTAIEQGLVRPEEYPSIEFLIHQETTIAHVFEGKDFQVFGSPYTPRYFEWAYMKKREKMDQVWSSVPEVDILITHGPPMGILDRTQDIYSKEMVSAGCRSLRRHVGRIKPKVHAFGHIHDDRGRENYGVFERDGTRFVNCAVCDNRGDLKHNGIVLDL